MSLMYFFRYYCRYLFKDPDPDKRESSARRGRLGLVQLYPDPSNIDATTRADVDIIAMHGLRARSPKTWEAFVDPNDRNSLKVNWLKDAHMLPSVVPHARIMTYDWNADIVGDPSADRFLGHADMLLGHLMIDRQMKERSNRPIVFVASCFSGLLLAKALLRAADQYHPEKAKVRRVLDLTIGVIFLGTPFKGSWKYGYQNASLWVEVAKQEGEQCSPELIQYLRPEGREDGGGGPSPLNELVQRFAEMVKNKQLEFPITCFYETQPTEVASLFNGLSEEIRPVTKGREVTVPETSACLDGAHRIGLNVRHNMLHKHNSPETYEFRRISTQIKDFADAADQTLQWKYKIQNEFLFAPAPEIAKNIKSAEFSSQQSHYFNMYRPKTNMWFLESEEFREWENGRQTTLFCPGAPGAGKTVLTSAVVDYLHTKYCKNGTWPTALAFVYFSYERQKEQKVGEILCSILKQLLCMGAPPSGEVLSLCNKYKNQAILPKLEEVSTAIRATASMFSRAFIIIDALDECDEGERGLLLPQLFRLRDECQANLFFTARSLPVIQTKLKDSITKVVRAQDQDIEVYVRHEFDQAMQWVIEENTQLKEEIVAVIVKETDGIFILARLYMNLLKGQLRLCDVECTLESFHSSGLKAGMENSSAKVDEAYAATVDRVNKQGDTYRKLAKQVLMWIIFARRPINKVELTHALAVHCIEQDTLDKKYFYDVNHIITACQGLVEIEYSSEIMRLTHPTAQEYLRQHFSRLDPTGGPSVSRPGPGQQVLSVRSAVEVHREMCLVCVTYMSFKQVGHGRLVSNLRQGKRDNILGYAAVYWGLHANLAWQGLSHAEKEFVLSFVKSPKLAIAHKVFLQEADTTDLSYWMQLSAEVQMDPVRMPLAMAVELSISQVIAELTSVPALSRTSDNYRNKWDKHSVPDLGKAARIGTLEVIGTLKDRGASSPPSLPSSVLMGDTAMGWELVRKHVNSVQRVNTNELLHKATLQLRKGRDNRTTEPPRCSQRSTHSLLALVSLFGRAKIVHEMLKVFHAAGFGPPSELDAKILEALCSAQGASKLHENSQLQHTFLPNPPPPQQLPAPSCHSRLASQHTDLRHR